MRKQRPVKVAIAFKVLPEEKAAFERLADTKDVTVSQLGAKAIREFLNRYAAEPTA